MTTSPLNTMLRGTKAAFLAFALAIASFGAGCEGAAESGEEAAEQIGTTQEALTATIAGTEVPANQCGPNQEWDGQQLCYTKCPEGYYSQITRCIRYCGSEKPGYYEVSGYPGICMNRQGQSFVPSGYDRGAGVPPNSCPAGFVKKPNGKCKPQPSEPKPPTAEENCKNAGKYWSQLQGACLVYESVDYYKDICAKNNATYNPAKKNSTFPCDIKQPGGDPVAPPAGNCFQDPDCMAVFCSMPGNGNTLFCSGG